MLFEGWLFARQDPTVFIVKTAPAVIVLLIALLPELASAESMVEATQKRAAQIERDQIAVMDRLTREGRVPPAWLQEMKAFVLPDSTRAALAAAESFDELMALQDYVSAAGGLKASDELAKRVGRVATLLRQQKARFEENYALRERIHAKHKIPMPKSAAVSRAKWEVVSSAGEVFCRAADKLVAEHRGGRVGPTTLDALSNAFDAVVAPFEEAHGFSAAFQARTDANFERLKRR